jgi:RND family efflux transporter MFP subunit
MRVEQQEVIEWIRTVGSVSADKSVTLSSEVGGTVAEILAEVGDPVTKGMLLARLDDERFRIARDMAKAEMEKAAASLENSKREAERHVQLFEDNVTSESYVEQVRLKVSTDEAQLKAARASLAAAERDLEDTRIVSPIGGEIGRRHIEIGELVQPGTPLFDIVDIAHVEVIVQISEREITRVYKGQDATIEVDGYPGIVFHGTVNTISAEAESATRTYPVEILVINDRVEKLLPGFIGSVKIRGRTFENAIILPENVVVSREGRPVVFVIENNRASMRTVEIGFADRGEVLISKGLKPGEQVVITGQEPLRDGAVVQTR